MPVGPIYSVEDMMSDPHYNARGMFETVEINGEPKNPRYHAEAQAHRKNNLARRGHRRTQPRDPGWSLGMSDEEIASYSQIEDKKGANKPPFLLLALFRTGTSNPHRRHLAQTDG